MQLIGVLDSPYVRRVAISLKMMGLPFTHVPLSVFRDYDRFATMNPAVKAPTLVTDEGVVLMDSALILDHLERLVPYEVRLTPTALSDHAHAQRFIGLALAACEKTAQIVYEYELRPAEKRHLPWLDRIRGQLAAAYGLLESEIQPSGPWLFGMRPMQADLSVAVAWRFTQSVIADEVDAKLYPNLSAFSDRAERLDHFISTPPE